MATSFTMLKLFRPQTYPYASSSTGPYRGLLVRKYPCWEAQGPVRDVFMKEIVGKLRELLKQCLPESNSFISFSLFMVGKLPEKTKPYIMIVSDDEPLRKKAFHLVKSKNILVAYPGFELGHCYVEAEYKDLRRLGSDSMPSASSMISIEDLEDFLQHLDDEGEPGPEVMSLLSADVCAFEAPNGIKPTRLYFHTSSNPHPHNSASATCGGLLRYRNEIYALTMAHAIHPTRRIPMTPEAHSDSSRESGDFEFTGMDDWDEDDDEDTKTLTAITSPGSKTPSEYSDSEESLLRRRDSQLSSETSVRTRVATGPPAIYEDDYIMDGNEDFDEVPEMCERIGSVVGVDQVLDIAVIKTTLGMSGKDLEDTPFIHTILDSFPEIDLSGVERAFQIDASSTSITIKTTHQEIRGQRSPTPFYTRLPGTSDFLELYGARLSTSLRPGDSGSWAFNDIGDFCGLVIAGSPQTGSCLLLPAVPALRSINALLMMRKWPLQVGTWVNSLEPKPRPGILGILPDEDAMTVASSLPPPSVFSHRGTTPSTITHSTTTATYDRLLTRESLPQDDTKSSSSFVSKGDFMQDQVARLRRELERAWEIIQEKDEQLQRLLIDNVDDAMNTAVKETALLQPEDIVSSSTHPVRDLEREMSRSSPTTRSDTPFDFTFADPRNKLPRTMDESDGLIESMKELVAVHLKSLRDELEKSTKSTEEARTMWRAQVDANEALNQENTELKMGIRNLISAFLGDEKGIDNYDGPVDTIVELQRLLHNNDASPQLLPPLVKVKSEAEPKEAGPTQIAQFSDETRGLIKASSGIPRVKQRLPSRRILTPKSRMNNRLLSGSRGQSSLTSDPGPSNNIFPVAEEDEDDGIDDSAATEREGGPQEEIKDERV
ncbi:hypothetical protein F5Y10DRAFT_232913 [Nemania abortiva]|nr:hypothetical protein F5Y10DRAFT_232913 [Nemania abortiva]